MFEKKLLNRLAVSLSYFTVLCPSVNTLFWFCHYCNIAAFTIKCNNLGTPLVAETSDYKIYGRMVSNIHQLLGCYNFTYRWKNYHRFICKSYILPSISPLFLMSPISLQKGNSIQPGSSPK